MECQFEGELGGTDWYSGRIEAHNKATGRYDVLFDDGDREANVHPRYLRPVTRGPAPPAAPVAAAAAAPVLYTGVRVECLFEGALGGDQWHPGQIEAASEVTGRFDILYDDGDREANVERRFIRLPSAPAGDGAGAATTSTGATLATTAAVGLPVAARVLCQFEGALGGDQWFAGVVEARHDPAGTYDILYDDGDHEEGVLPQFVRPLLPTTNTSATATATSTSFAATNTTSLAVGARVLCLFEGALGGDQWFAGVVEARHDPAGTYDILYDDGDREQGVLPQFVRLPTVVELTPTRTPLFAVGDLVECQFEGALGGTDWCVRACVLTCLRACVRARARARVCVCGGGGRGGGVCEATTHSRVADSQPASPPDCGLLHTVTGGLLLHAVCLTECHISVGFRVAVHCCC